MEQPQNNDVIPTKHTSSVKPLYDSAAYQALKNGEDGIQRIDKQIDLSKSTIQLYFQCGNRCDEDAFQQFSFAGNAIIPSRVNHACELCGCEHMDLADDALAENGAVLAAMVIFDCSLSCGSGRDFRYGVSKVIPAVLGEPCPSCEKGILVLDAEGSRTIYGTYLVDVADPKA